MSDKTEKFLREHIESIRKYALTGDADISIIASVAAQTLDHYELMRDTEPNGVYASDKPTLHIQNVTISPLPFPDQVRVDMTLSDGVKVAFPGELVKG